MIDNYKIFMEFQGFLPEVGDDEVYFLALYCRKKYGAKKDLCLKRSTASTKAWLASKVEQLRPQDEGAYIYNENDPEIIDSTSYVAYMMPNPRNTRKATLRMTQTMIGKLVDPNSRCNPISESYRAVQMAKGTGNFCHFDIDREDKRNIDTEVGKVVNLDACAFIETRGGMHLLVDSKRVHPRWKSSFYPALKEIEGCDQDGDILLPIPGTRQGGHLVTFANMMK